MVTVAGLRRIELSILHFPTTDFLLTGCLLKECVTERFKSFKTVQPSRGVLTKRFSENKQQIYRRTPMPKCDFSKVAKQYFSMIFLTAKE